MSAAQQLHDLGQSPWLDNITRGLLTGGTLRRYIRDFSVTGPTTNSWRRPAGTHSPMPAPGRNACSGLARARRIPRRRTRSLYVAALAAPDTVNTMPENTLQAFAEHRRLKDVLPTDGGDAEDILAEFTQAGVNDAVLAAHLQREGTESFTKSWNDLLDCLASKSVTLKRLDRTGGKR